MALQTGVTDGLAIEKPFNNLLRTLRDQDYVLIAPHLVAAEQAANELLYNPGDDVDMTAPADGRRVTQAQRRRQEQLKNKRRRLNLARCTAACAPGAGADQ